MSNEKPVNKKKKRKQEKLSINLITLRRIMAENPSIKKPIKFLRKNSAKKGNGEKVISALAKVVSIAEKRGYRRGYQKWDPAEPGEIHHR